MEAVCQYRTNTLGLKSLEFRRLGVGLTRSWADGEATERKGRPLAVPEPRPRSWIGFAYGGTPFLSSAGLSIGSRPGGWFILLWRVKCPMMVWET